MFGPGGLPSAPRSMVDRFWERVQKTPGCWGWLGRPHRTGYGVIVDENGRQQRAHRVSWQIHFGPIPDGKCVCHTCDVRTCVNPGHLWLGSHADNQRDCARKGRARARALVGSRAAAARLRNDPAAREAFRAGRRAFMKRWSADNPDTFLGGQLRRKNAEH